VNTNLVLADAERLAQFLLMQQARPPLSDLMHWMDESELSWAGLPHQGHWFAICLQGQSWIFDRYACEARRDRLESQFRHVAQMSPDERTHFGFRRFQDLRLGPLTARLAWLIHTWAIQVRRSVFRIPDTEIAECLWRQGQRPRHWRNAINRSLDTMKLLHISKDEANGFPRLGASTGLLIHAADLFRSSNDGCDRDCPVLGGPPHHHFLINVAPGFLGILDQCSVAEDAGVRTYEFPARGNRSTGATLQQLGRTGRLMTVYLPAVQRPTGVGPSFTASQMRLFHAMFRERTRKRRESRTAFTEPALVTDGKVPSTCGRRSLICPLLSTHTEYAGFNGNGRRSGCGYLFRTWLQKGGYAPDQLNQFCEDLEALAGQLSVVNVGILRSHGRTIWLSLSEMQAMLANSPRLAHSIHLRFYAQSDHLTHWDILFGWNSPNLGKDDDPTAQLGALTRQLKASGITRKALAAALGVDASLISKILLGRRPLPSGFFDRAIAHIQQVLEQQALPEPVTSEPSDERRHGDLALQYLQHGWSVIPQQPGTKQPYVKWKHLQVRPVTEAEISEWWSRWPDAGISLVAGPVSDVFVVDVDGEDAYNVLLTRLGTEPNAPKVFSGSRQPHRFHLFFRHPSIDTSAKKTPWHSKLEFRGRGGLAVLPPSLHPSGNTYAWAAGRTLADLPLPELPAVIVESLRGNEATARRRGPLAQRTERAKATNANQFSGLASSTVDFISGVYANASNWNDRLFRAACDMAANGIEIDEAIPALISGAAPWTYEDEQAANATIESAYARDRVSSRF
jgi:transcriptional regulator with XRE-family HTH domain